MNTKTQAMPDATTNQILRLFQCFVFVVLLCWLLPASIGANETDDCCNDQEVVLDEVAMEHFQWQGGLPTPWIGYAPPFINPPNTETSTAFPATRNGACYYVGGATGADGGGGAGGPGGSGGPILTNFEVSLSVDKTTLVDGENFKATAIVKNLGPNELPTCILKLSSSSTDNVGSPVQGVDWFFVNQEPFAVGQSITLEFERPFNFSTDTLLSSSNSNQREFSIVVECNNGLGSEYLKSTARYFCNIPPAENPGVCTSPIEFPPNTCPT